MGPTPDQNTGPRVPRPFARQPSGRFGPIQQVPRTIADDADGADAKVETTLPDPAGVRIWAAGRNGRAGRQRESVPPYEAASPLSPCLRDGLAGMFRAVVRYPAASLPSLLLAAAGAGEQPNVSFLVARDRAPMDITRASKRSLSPLRCAAWGG
jgi:hypothetical protein